MKKTQAQKLNELMEEQFPMKMSELILGDVYKVRGFYKTKTSIGDTVVATLEDNNGDILNVFMPKKFNYYADLKEEEDDEYYMIYKGLVKMKGRNISYHDLKFFDQYDEAKKASKEFKKKVEKIDEDD